MSGTSTERLDVSTTDGACVDLPGAKIATSAMVQHTSTFLTIQA